MILEFILKISQLQT